MSTVHIIDTVTEWAREHICAHIKLKQPPANLNAPNDEGYQYTLVTPSAFAMYVPTSEKLPPHIRSPFPSLCVNFVTGQDEPASGRGYVDIQLNFSAWEPGTHGRDILRPNNDGSFSWWSGEEADKYFRRNGEGWRDVWNFADIALREVESASHIGGYTIDRTTPVKYGPFIEQEGIPDLYPTWFAWVRFRVTYPLQRKLAEVDDLL